MVGLLATAIGVALWIEARASRPVGSIVLLAVLSAISFAAIDVRFALAGRISSVYLLDAIAEVVLLLAVAAGGMRVRHTDSDERRMLDGRY